MPLPTQILDLQVRDLDLDHVRLCITRNEPARYACLWYFWGSPDTVMKTNQATPEDHCKEIIVSALPATFRDTVTFVRKLGIHFLWVDSLCIIQDDPLDWRESSKMSNIYTNSFITVAEAKSSDGQGWLFSSTLPEHLGHAIPYTNGISSTMNTYARQSLLHDPYWIAPEGDKLPLFRRGWAYQERLLAPRVLNYTSNELVMEYLGDVICECSGIKSRYIDWINGFLLPYYTF